MLVHLYGSTQDGVAPRDIAQYVVGYLGEDSAIYKAIEYGGPYIQRLSIEDRMLFPLMSIDLGAKASFINPDEKTVAYARSFSKFKDWEILTNDSNIQYDQVVDIDVSKLEPQVACPPTVGK
jgi:3-isopropylmalate/(R)-2-methylmalate dehydratase large subunit